jgi:hypothetical protein
MPIIIKNNSHKFKFEQRKPRYTENECYLIASLVFNQVDLQLWNGDVILVDQSESLLTDIKNKYGETLFRTFNKCLGCDHDYHEEDLIKHLLKLKAD